jgi:hypothetical protein
MNKQRNKSNSIGSNSQASYFAADTIAGEPKTKSRVKPTMTGLH